MFTLEEILNYMWQVEVDAERTDSKPIEELKKEIEDNGK